MPKYFCSNCGYGSASWYGKCPSCSEWNTFEAAIETKKSGNKSLKKAEFTALSKISSLSSERLSTGIYEFDRVIGGGFIKGEVVGKHKIRSAIETLLIGGVAAGIAYFVGYLLKGLA